MRKMCNAGMTKSKAGHYTVWIRDSLVKFNYLELYQAQKILKLVQAILQMDLPPGDQEARLRAVAY